MQVLDVAALVSLVALTAAGVYGLMCSRNVLRMVVSAETLFNAMVLAVLVILRHGGVVTSNDAALLLLTVIVLTAVEVGVVASLLVLLHHVRRSADLSTLREVRG